MVAEQNRGGYRRVPASDVADAPVPDTGSAAEDCHLTLRGMMRFYTSPSGAIYAQLVGDSQFDPTARERLRMHQMNVGSR